MTEALYEQEQAPAAEPREIGFYTYPGFAALALTGPLEVFAMSTLLNPGSYRITLLSRTGGPVEGSGGIQIASVAAPSRPLDTLLVVGGPQVPSVAPEDLDAIRAYAASARRTASVCTGAFLLAGAGVLDGRRVTTHWGGASRLQHDFPAVRVDADRIYVRDGSVWSSAGMSAGIDLALALIEEDHGVEHARSVARYLVVENRRHGGQSQYSELLALEPALDRIAQTLSFIRLHLGEPLTVDRLAAVAGLSARQFRRAFREQTGESPARAVERLRVEAAKARVERGSEPIESIAVSLGFTDPERMRRAFVRRFGLSPQDSRRAARNFVPILD